MRKLLVIWLLAACAVSLRAERFHFDNLSTDAGLSNKMVLSIAQDPDGFIWIATAEGLNRYDGAGFRVFTHRPGDEKSLGASWVNDVFVTADSTLLAATEMGLSCYDPLTGSFSVYPAVNDSQALLSTLRFKCVTEDAESIWAGTSEGLVRIDKANAFLSFVKLSPTASDDQANEVKDVLRDSGGRLWVATFDGLYLFNDRDFTHRRFEIRDRRSYDQTNNYVSSLCQFPSDGEHLYIGTSNGLAVMDLSTYACRYYRTETSDLCNNDVKFVFPFDENRLLVGTAGGLSVFHCEEGSFENYSSSLIDRTSLASQILWCAFEDRLGELWLGTSNGISKMDKNRKSLDFSRIVSGKDDNLRDVMVSDLVFIPDGHLWVGTAEGILSYNPDMELEKVYSLGKSGLPHNMIKRLLRTRSGQVWVGTNNGIACYQPQTDRFVTVRPSREDISIKYVYDMKEDSDGDIIVNISNGLCILTPHYSRSGTLSSYETRSVRIDHMIYSGNTDVTYLDTDREGRIWFGTINDGLFSYDKRTGVIGQYIFEKDNPSSPSSNRIYTLHVSRDGFVWVGTDMGLYRLDPRTGKCRRFSDDLDLSQAVRTITSDPEGRLWICLLDKVIMYDPATDTKIVCDVQQDLDCDELEYNSCTQQDGNLYFGGYGGVVRVDPQSVSIRSARAPMRITGIEIPGRAPLDDIPSDRLVLGSGENAVTVSFALLDYSSELNNKYQYRLEGFDTDWKQTDGHLNRVSYSNLSPGRYRFVVKGYNPDGVFSDEVSFPFWIRQPLLLRWWAILGMALLFLTLLGIGIWQYITHRKLSLQLDAEKEERSRVESLNKVKMNFFTNISHEFKTPLSLILGPLESLMENTSDPHQLVQMKLMQQNGQRMLRLINQILDLRKIDNEKLTLNLSSGDMVAFAREVFDSFRENAVLRKMNYSFEADGEVSCQFDKDKMENVLYNLLSNAFKFTPDGGSVTLRVSRAAGNVRLSVQDSGQGMTEAEQEKIFDRFYQGAARSYEKISSTGIGLGLTKDFVELQGGTILVESTPGKGSTFTVTLPGRMPQAKEDMAGELGNELERCIVVIDDNPDILTFIRVNLSDQYEVLTASSAEEGLALVRENCPDVVISDVMMPGMDGYALCSLLRRDELTSHIPVILLTARDTEEDQARGYESGADGFLSKPFSVKVLRAKIEVLITSREKLRQYYLDQFRNPGAKPASDSADDRFMSTLVKTIEANLDNSEYSVKNLCEDTPYSYLQIYRKVKALTGIPVNEFIRNLRLSKAAYLLEHSQLRVSEIMYSVGFSTHSYFTKCFKDCYGLTPKEYARSKRKNAVEE